MKTKCKTFPLGGVHPADNKLSALNAIIPATVPLTVTIPLSQHIGAEAKPNVAIGDKVKVGQLIAEAQGFISANVHASVSGTVKKIEAIMNSSGFKQNSIVIEGENDQWLTTIDHSDKLLKEITCSREEITQRIKNAGIVGCGGATFPAHVKLSVPPGKEKAKHLIINGVECEPFLTSDHRLMIEKPEEILVGIQIVLKALDINSALVGIENNKIDAIDTLSNCALDYNNTKIIPLKTLYPQGGERQLIKALINKEIPPPPQGLPIDVGCVVFNIGTIFAIYEAVQKNKPFIERVVTITGKSVLKPSNFLTRIGTPLTQLLEAAGGIPDNTGKIIAGGPMMGKTLSTQEVPVTKGMSGVCLISEDEALRSEVLNCIRCGKCVERCPLGLEPYLLMTLAEKQLLDRSLQERMLNCCECACCTYICPAKRPLLDFIRIGKKRLLTSLREKQQK